MSDAHETSKRRGSVTGESGIAMAELRVQEGR
jgi:hypothetical protein